MALSRVFVGVKNATKCTSWSAITRPNTVISFRTFSNDNDNFNSDVPDEFYDDEVEAEKEFCDISMSLIHKRGLEGINSIKDNYSWNDLSKFTNRPVRDPTCPSTYQSSADDQKFNAFIDAVKNYRASVNEDGGTSRAEKIQQLKDELAKQLKTDQNSQMDNTFTSDGLENAHVYEESDSEYELDNRNVRQIVKESKRKPFVPGISDAERVDESALSAVKSTVGYDFQERLAHVEDRMFYRPHDININDPDFGMDEEPDPLLENFVKDTDPSKYEDEQQGLRHCPGKLQRRGKRLDAPLGCHLIDLDTVSPIDVLSLKRFLSIDAEILHRKHTGLCSKCQRKVARTIKQSRAMGLLPHIGMLSLADFNPLSPRKPFHGVVKGGGKKNKPIMSQLVPLN